jgi:hypothetical protein
VLSQNAGGLVLGILAVLIGFGGIAAAVRARRRRSIHPDAYASAGGIVYTAVQIGCSGLMLAGGAGVIVLVLITHR